MSANRKLQSEIERCLKKVDEGVVKFEETWQKVQHASNTNQKEKYEEDLKKEIKRLQRLRDQIKSWLTNGAINDKSVLMEKRKLIETQMERFKVVERETKTKAYSKEGLIVSAKKDPAEKERCEMSDWLNSCIDQLNVQIDQFEAEIETLGTSKKKKKNAETQEQIEEIQNLLEKHRCHVQKLETLLRMLDNDTVNIDQIKDIKDSVEYYIESCRESDFMEDDGLYDDIDGLEEMMMEVNTNFRDKPSGSVGSSTSSHHDHNNVDVASSEASTNSANSPVPTASTTSSTMGMHNHTNSERHESMAAAVASGTSGSSEAAKRRHKSASEEVKAKSGSPSLSGSKALSSSTVPKHPNNSTSSSNMVISSNQQHFSTAASKGAPNNSSTSSGPPGLNNGQTPQAEQQAGIKGVQNFAAAVALKQMNGHPPSDMIPNSSLSSPAVSSSNGGSGTAGEMMQFSLAAARANGNGSTNNSATPPVGVASREGLPASLKSMAEEAAGLNRGDEESAEAKTAAQAQQHAGLSIRQQGLFPTSESSSIRTVTSSASGAPSQVPASVVTTSTSSVVANNSTAGQGGHQGEANIPPLLGVAPLGRVPLTKETTFQYQMLEAAFQHMPHPSDSERLRPYLPRNPCPTPLYYPQLASPGSDSIEFFQKLSTETLFFIFYYMEGTQAQFLAAKALKKQSWRFHTKYMMWFQRHEEPKVINDEYEQGTYIYFDYEKWGQRKKEGFTFEYRFLEDRDLN